MKARLTATRAMTRLSEEIAASAKRFAALTNADPICKRLMTIPGVGPSTALRFRLHVKSSVTYVGGKTVPAAGLRGPAGAG